MLLHFHILPKRYSALDLVLTERCKQDMHYAEFAEDEVGPTVVTAAKHGDDEHGDGNENVLTPAQSAALLAAIKQYDADKWKVIGQKVGKPAKVSTFLNFDRSSSDV